MKNSLTLLLLCCATGAVAQDGTATEEELPVRQYGVEVIIFSYAENVAGGTEIFVPDELPADDLPGDVEELAPLPRKRRNYEIVMLRKDEFTLGEAYGRLQRLDAYKPLMHFGWTQPTYPDEEPQSRPLSSFARPPRGLQGDLTLYLSRFLHLVVNLQLDAKPAKAVPGIASSTEGPTRYQITEDRIFRNGELRYFDHPKFGALVKIWRVEEVEEADEDEFFNTEFLGE